jgi:hypothetical protein
MYKTILHDKSGAPEYDDVVSKYITYTVSRTMYSFYDLFVPQFMLTT